MALTPLRKSGILLTLLVLAACRGDPDGALAHQCSNGLDTAYGELTAAETEGFGGTVDWSKAASLLTAAKVQYEFEKYPNCIDKVDRARAYIRRATAG